MTARDDLLAIPDDVLRDATLTEVLLVKMDFVDTPRSWWTGFGDLSAHGETWQGMGDIIQVEGLSTNYQVSATPVTFTVAATPEMVEISRLALSRVLNRDVFVWSQLMAVRDYDGTSAWQIVGPRLSLFTGTMRRAPMRVSGEDQAEVQVVCEGLFTDRNAPPHGRLTDADQKARHPGDRGLEFVARYVDYETRWI